MLTISAPLNPHHRIVHCLLHVASLCCVNVHKGCLERYFHTPFLYFIFGCSITITESNIIITRLKIKNQALLLFFMHESAKLYTVLKIFTLHIK